MKKKLISVACLVFAGILTAVGVYQRNHSVFFDTVLANIEALAEGEGVVQVPCLRLYTDDCSFFILDAEDNLHVATWPGYLYVNFGN